MLRFLALAVAVAAVRCLDLDTFRQQTLDRHNYHRAKHGVSAMTLDDTINDVSQKWAQKLADEHDFNHSNNPEYGENIAANTDPNIDGNISVDDWYSEIKLYDYQYPGYSDDTGHFTQVVWKDSTHLGIGWAVADDGTSYVVGNYYPPGNYDNEFVENVLPLVE